MPYTKQEEAIEIANENRIEWNIKTANFFVMGLTAAVTANICPDGIVPIMVASTLSVAGAMLSSAYMAHQNQKAINDLKEKPLHKVQVIIENVENLSVESTMGNIAKSIKAIRENNKTEESLFKPKN